MSKQVGHARDPTRESDSPAKAPGKYPSRPKSAWQDSYEPDGDAQAAFGNALVSTIEFEDPLVITAEDKSASENSDDATPTVNEGVLTFEPMTIYDRTSGQPGNADAKSQGNGDDRPVSNRLAKLRGQEPVVEPDEKVTELDDAAPDRYKTTAARDARAEKDPVEKTNDSEQDKDTAKRSKQLKEAAKTEDKKTEQDQKKDVNPLPDKAEAKPGPAEDTVKPKTKSGGTGVRQHLAAWRAKVSQSTKAAPKPDLGDAAKGDAKVRGGGRRANAKRNAKPSALAKSAKKARSKPPETEKAKTLPPPKPSPEPKADQKIDAASDKKLPKQVLPKLVRRPVGTPKGFTTMGPMPKLDANLAAEMSTSLTVTPPPPTKVEGPAVADVKDKDKDQLKKIKDAKDKPVDTKKSAEAGATLVLDDTTPKKLPPVEVGTGKQSKQRVAQIIGELRKSAKKESTEIVKEARKEAYPKKALQMEYSDIGKELEGEVEANIKNKVESIRKVAGISAEELDSAMKAREEELKELNDGAIKAIGTASTDSKEKIKDSGRKEADKVLAARESVDDNTLQQLIEANGEGDPTVINMRRDIALRNLASRAAQQDIYYEKSEQRRQKALDAMSTRFSNAYKNAAKFEQQEAYKKAIDAGTAEATAKTQSETATTPIFQWAVTQIRAAARSIGELKTQVTKAIKGFRAGIKNALDEARGLVRDWASDKISEKESWWEKILRWFREWAQDAQDDTAAWEEARNQALRDDVVGDLNMIDEIHLAMRSGVDAKTYIQERGLDQAQASIIQAYFDSVQKGKPDAIGAVATGLKMRVRKDRKPVIIKSMKSKLMSKPDSDWEKMANIGNKERPPFHVVSIASDLFKSMDQWGTDEDKVYKALSGLTPLQTRALKARYRTRYGKSIMEHLKDEMSGAELTRAKALLRGNQTLADVAALHEAMHGGLTGLGTDEDAIMQTLRGKSQEDRDKIIAEYKRQYGKDLKKELKSELDDGWSSHHDHHRASALMEGNLAKADAIALDQAMHGGWTGAGTDEGQITQVYEQTRREVKAQAAREGWTTERMNAEILARNKAIEEEYGSKYGDPNKKTGKSALRKALESELSYEELDLALALGENNMAKADAARLQIEKYSFITDDEVVNKVLESQHKRAVADVTRDKEYDLNMRAEVDGLRDKPWKRAKWDKERTNLKKEIETESNKRAKLYMSNLENAYDDKYSRFGKGGLQVLIAFNMSGNDRQKAYDLLEQGGKLNPEQEIFYAVNGPGTDVDALKKVLEGKSPEEVQAIRKAWNEKYTKSPYNEPKFDERIKDEVGGRDHKDMEWALQGEPQTPEGKLKRAKEKMDYESTAYWLGSSEDDPERKDMKDRYDSLKKEKLRLDKLKANPPQKREDESDEDFAKRLRESKEEFAYWNDSFDLKEGYFNRTVEDHRAAVDSLADTASTIAAIVATVVVIAVVSFFTAGTGGAAIVATLASAKVAAATAAAAAVATIGTKLAIKGSAYSSEEIALDAVVGAVDAIASAMTAGVGGALLKGVRAGVKPVSKLAGIAARSGTAARLSKMAASNKASTRIFANALAEGIEGVVATVPSALAGNVLNEKNWVKGNPVANIFTGTFIETGMGAVLSGGLGSLGGLGKHADAIDDKLPATGDILAKRGTPAERAAKWADFQIENPGKPYKDFLSDLDAGLIAKEADEAAIKAMQRKMRTELFTDIPPAQRGQFADVPIEIMSDADFQRFTRSAKGQAVVIFDDGKPRVIMREGADPRILREEGIHLLQSKDPKFAKHIADLDETRLANWKTLDLEEQLRLYRTKLDVEIDGQRQLLKNLDDQLASIDDPALRKRLLAQRDAAMQDLDNLGKRLDEVDGFTPTERLNMASGEMGKPQYLDQKPRLFSKTDDINSAAKLRQTVDEMPEGGLNQRTKPDESWAKRVEAEDITEGLEDIGGLNEKAMRDKFSDVVDPDQLDDLLPKRSREGFRKAAYAQDSRKFDKQSVFRRARENLVQFLANVVDEHGNRLAKNLFANIVRFKRALNNQSFFAPFIKFAPGILDLRISRLLNGGTHFFDDLLRISNSASMSRKRFEQIFKVMRDVAGSDMAHLDKADGFIRKLRRAVELEDTYRALKMAGDVDQMELDRAFKAFNQSLGDLNEFKTMSSHVKLIQEELISSGRWNWNDFRAALKNKFEGKEFSDKFDSLIEQISKKWPGGADANDIALGLAPIKRWADVIDQLYKDINISGTGTKLGGFLDELNKNGNFKKLFKDLDLPASATPEEKLTAALVHMFEAFGPGYNNSRYKDFRQFLKESVLAATMAQNTPAAKLKFLQDKYLSIIRNLDSASVGEYFAAFRRTILDADDNLPIRGHLKGVKNIDAGGRTIAGSKNMVDGSVDVGHDLGRNRPKKGLHAIEDKAGKSYDPEQAEFYSKNLWDDNGNMKVAGQDHKGVIYFFESVDAARKKARQFNDLNLHENIYVVTFDQRKNPGPLGRMIFIDRHNLPGWPPTPPG